MGRNFSLTKREKRRDDTLVYHCFLIMGPPVFVVILFLGICWVHSLCMLIIASFSAGGRLSLHLCCAVLAKSSFILVFLLPLVACQHPRLLKSPTLSPHSIERSVGKSSCNRSKPLVMPFEEVTIALPFLPWNQAIAWWGLH